MLIPLVHASQKKNLECFVTVNHSATNSADSDRFQVTRRRFEGGDDRLGRLWLRKPCFSPSRGARRERQHGFSGERRQRKMVRLCGIDPSDLFDFRSRADGTRQFDAIQSSLHDAAHFVRGRSAERARNTGLPGCTEHLSSSLSSRSRAARCDSESRSLPPGCMNARVPFLRTSNTRCRSSRTTAATIRMTFPSSSCISS
jgi:hypothetical protein